MNSRFSFLCLVAIVLFLNSSYAAEIIYKNDSNFNFYFISGEIQYGDDRKFEQIVANNHRASKEGVVVLDSIGGNVFASLGMSKLIMTKNFVTTVMGNKSCYSACFIVFISGNSRFADQNSHMGVHRISTDTGEDERTKGASVDINELYRARNVPPAIRLAMLETPASEMYILSTEEKRQISTFDDSQIAQKTRNAPSTSEVKKTYCGSLWECTDELAKILNSNDYITSEVILTSLVPEIVRLTAHQYSAEQSEQLAVAIDSAEKQIQLAVSILSSAGITDKYSVTRISSTILTNLALELLFIDNSFTTNLQRDISDNPPVYMRFKEMNSLAFSDRYNELRELCKAGFCNEELVKKQEFAWIKRMKAMKNIYKNTQNETLVTEFMIERQIIFINVLKYVISSQLKNSTYITKFDLSSPSHLMTSISQLHAKMSTLSVDEVKQYNAVLGAYVIPYVEYELKEAGYDRKEFTDISLTGGAYDLAYREFFVSSNRKYFGKDYNRATTEYVKLEGKIMRAANMLLLLLKKRELNTASYFRCQTQYCTKQDAERIYKDFENYAASLKTICRQKKCNAKTLERMQKIYIQYDKLMGKLAIRHKIPNLYHTMSLMRAWAVGRLQRDYNTYSQ